MELNDRLRNAMTALSAYFAAKGDVCDDGHLAEEDFADLIADLRHLAASHGVDWTRVQSLATLHFMAEQGDQDRALDAARRTGALPGR